MNFKEITIGELIKQRKEELQIDTNRILNFLKCDEDSLEKMLHSKSIDTEMLLRWSKLLNYDFFRLYSQHLVLYAVPDSLDLNKKNEHTSLPTFRKQLYTKEIIDFILDEIASNSKTKSEIIKIYGIPKTTLHRWLNKYKTNEHGKNNTKL